MGSDSDFPIVSKAIKQLKDYEVPFEVHVMSAHRTPDEASEFAKNAIKNGFGVIIAAAGMAAQHQIQGSDLHLRHERSDR